MSLDGAMGASAPHLRLEIERSAGGHSRIARHRATFPWSFSRGFRTSGEAVLAIPQTAGAGVFGGESVAQEAVLGPFATLRWHVPGALMIHPGRDSSREARLDQRFSLAEGAAMTLEGEPCALLSGAFLHFETTISVASGARFLGFDGVCAARGGGHGFRLITRVITNGETAFEDRQAASFDAVARLAAQGWTAFGTVLALGPGVEAPPLGALDLGDGVYAGAAPLRGVTGLGVRIAARDGGALRRAGREMLARLGGEAGM